MNSKHGFYGLPKSARWVIVAFCIAGIIDIAAVFSTSAVPMNLWRLIAFMIVAGATARCKVQLSKSSTLSLLTPIVLLSLLSEGILAAMIVGICGVTIQLGF